MPIRATDSVRVTQRYKMQVPAIEFAQDIARSSETESLDLMTNEQSVEIGSMMSAGYATQWIGRWPHGQIRFVQHSHHN